MWGHAIGPLSFVVGGFVDQTSKIKKSKEKVDASETLSV
jgi:hypothetical protein